MKSKNNFKTLSFLFLILVFPFTSCDKEDDYFYYFDEGYIESIFQGHYYDADKTWRLCSRSWYLDYSDRYGYYEEIVTFYKERRGVVEYYFNGYYDGREYFDWYWDNLSQTRIFMHYRDGGYSIFRNIRVGNYDLSGTMNGVDIYYTAIY